MGMGKVIRSKFNKAMSKIAAQKNMTVAELLAGGSNVQSSASNIASTSGDIKASTTSINEDPMKGLLGDYQVMDEDVLENFRKRKNF